MEGYGVGLVTLTGDAAAMSTTAPGVAEVVAAPPDPLARRRQQVAVEREAQRDSERRFRDACAVCKLAFEMAASQPAKGREHAEQLTRDLLDSIMVDQELSIRLMHETSGDRSSLHAMNVSVVSLLMGRTLGLSEEDMLDLGVGALLHDVGKLGIPERVRFRDDHFTSAETQCYQEHVALGVSAGRRMGLRPGALLVIGQHHELADGSGFPLRLGSDRTGMASRIVALVNRYDNLCNPSLPAKSLTPHEALSLLFAQGKNKFDVSLMSTFIKMMGVYPPGSAVQLTDDRYALVTTVNSTRPLKPCVLVHDGGVPREEALLLDLERHPGLGIRRSLKPAQLPPEVLTYLSPRQRVTYYFEPATLPVDQEEAIS